MRKKKNRDLRVVTAISMPKQLLEQIDDRAYYEGMSRSGWICWVVRKELKKGLK